MLGFICCCCVISVGDSLSHSLPGGSSCPASSVPRPDMAALPPAHVVRRLPLAVGLQAEVSASQAARSQVDGLLPSVSSQAVRNPLGEHSVHFLTCYPPASTQPGFPCGPEPPGPVSPWRELTGASSSHSPGAARPGPFRRSAPGLADSEPNHPRAAIRLSRI